MLAHGGLITGDILDKGSKGENVVIADLGGRLIW
jgi:hypothetical protein